MRRVEVGENELTEQKAILQVDCPMHDQANVIAATDLW